MAKTKRQKTIYAGNLVKVMQASAAMPRDSEVARREKAKLTSAARQRINDRTSWQRLETILYTNFGAGDWFCTLTYRDGCLPASRDAAKKIMKSYLAKLRKFAALKVLANPMRYVYVTECRHRSAAVVDKDSALGDKLGVMAHDDGRLHHHMMINADAVDEELIRSLWIYGDQIDIKPVPVNARMEDYAKYMTKEPRQDGRQKVGQKSWAASRGLHKPKSETCWVDEHTELVAPPGVIVLERESSQNEFGEFAYLKYIVPEPAPRMVRRLRRTKNQRK